MTLIKLEHILRMPPTNCSEIIMSAVLLIFLPNIIGFRTGGMPIVKYLKSLGSQQRRDLAHFRKA